jgi:hypothetical protein
MDDMPTMLSPGEVDSIVLGAADNEVKRLGLTISPPAKDWLLQKSLRTLNDLNERAQLDSRRSEIERNTVSLIQLTFHEVLKDQRGERITVQHLEIALSAFCKRFKDFIPFCP